MRHRWQIFERGPRAGSLLKGKEFIEDVVQEVFKKISTNSNMENVDRVPRLWDNKHERFASVCNLSTDGDHFEIIDNE